MTCIPPCSCDCKTQEIAELRAELTSVREQLGNYRDFVRWVDSWVSNPVGSYSVHALDGLFGMTRDKSIGLIEDQQPRG